MALQRIIKFSTEERLLNVSHSGRITELYDGNKLISNRVEGYLIELGCHTKLVILQECSAHHCARSDQHMKNSSTTCNELAGGAQVPREGGGRGQVTLVVVIPSNAQSYFNYRGGRAACPPHFVG